MQRRLFLTNVTGLAVGAAGLALAGCTTTPSTPANPAARRREIDTAADSALSRLYTGVRGARELSDRARGVLVFPDVLAAGFVVGGEYGDGVLRSGGRASGYYRLVSGTLGFQIGAQSKAIVLMFMTPEALSKFTASSGWSAGVDANVALLRVGASGEIDTNTVRQDVVGFVLTNAGLMASANLEGSKITRLDI